MKARCKIGEPPARFGYRAQVCVAALITLGLSACSEQQDAQLQMQMAELRAALDKTKKELDVAQAEAAKAAAASPPASTSSTGGGADKAALTAAQTKIATLERELGEARAAASKSASTPPTSTKTVSLEGLKELVKKMESDLVTKTGELRDEVDKKLNTSVIQEITVRRIQPPPELANAFSSSILLTVLDPRNQPIRLEFPVRADFDGVWRMPTTEDVLKQFEDLKAGRIAVPTVAATAPETTSKSATATPATQPTTSTQQRTTAAPSATPAGAPGGGSVPTVTIDFGDRPRGGPAPAATTSTPAPAPQPAAPRSVQTPAGAPGGGGAVPTVVVDFGDRPRASSAPAARPAPAPSAPPSAPTPISNFSPSAPQPSAPAPRPSGAPAPIMPVQRDVIIKFE